MRLPESISPAKLVARAFTSFHPSSMPLLARPSYRVELVTVLFFAVTLAVIDGSFVGVFVKKNFAGVVPPERLNLVVALLTAAPEIANILSFIWVSLSHTRPKVPFVNLLQLVVIVLVASIALVDRTAGGLLALSAIVLAARIAWSGIITLRPTIWRANYARTERARIVGKFSTVQVLVIAAMGLGLGRALDFNAASYVIFMPAAAAIGLAAAWATSKLRVRGHRAILAGERRAGSEGVGRPWQGPAIVYRVLKRDPWFARFMIWMFVLGFGNIMLSPMIVIATQDQFRMGYTQSLIITTAIPLFLMPLMIPVWSRFLDRAHVVKFRSVHSWAFVAANAVFLLAAVTHLEALMYAGAALLAAGYAGGTLAWNLGHNDFAPPAQTSQYMATHVTLNGVRALLAPFVSVSLYNWLYDRGWGHDAAIWVIALALVFCIAGALGFVSLRRAMGHPVETAMTRDAKA